MKYREKVLDKYGMLYYTIVIIIFCELGYILLSMMYYNFHKAKLQSCLVCMHKENIYLIVQVIRRNSNIKCSLTFLPQTN